MNCLAIKEELTSSSVICRLCLVQNSTYCDVFGENHDYPEFADVLRNLLDISISPMDNWPKNVCTVCIEKISNFRTLLTQSKENEIHLTKVFGKYQLLDDKSFDVSLQKRGSPEFIVTELKEDVKDETLDDPIKDEDTDGADNFSCTSDQDIQEDQPPVLRKRNARIVPEKRVSKNIVKKQRIHASDIKPKHPTKEKKPKDAKRDAEIHTFFNMDCVLCDGMRFPRFEELQKHFRSSHRSRGYIVCCGKKLNSPMKMQLHMQEHKNPIKYQCSICFKYYKREDILKTHLKLQHTPVDQREFACNKCPQRFALASALKRHVIHHTAPEDRKHFCETCGRAFAASHILAAHVRRMHENALDSVCEICAKVYKSKYLFEKHMAEHNNLLKLNIPCPICGRMFKYVAAMQKHKRRHDTSGCLECHICQHVARNRRSLHEHIKRVHGERKTFPCSLCDRVFRKSRSLKEHMASHTGEMLYKCNFCPKEFNSNGNYFHHRKTVHPIEYRAEQERRRSEQVFQKN